MSITAHSPISSEASRQESQKHHRLVRASEMTSPISASPETGSVASSHQTSSPSRSRPQSEVSDAGNSPPHPTPASDATSPLVRSRPPMTSPTFSSQPTGQARMDRSQITMSRPITAAVDHYTSPYSHCLHDLGLHGAALGHCSLGWGEITP
jgi:hypothetical protein